MILAGVLHPEQAGRGGEGVNPHDRDEVEIKTRCDCQFIERSLSQTTSICKESRALRKGSQVSLD